MKLAVLEDEIFRTEEFKRKFPDCFITKNPNEFIQYVTHNHVDTISLDHDLGFFVFDENDRPLEINGQDVAFALIAQDLIDEKTKIIIHSHNVVCAPKMGKLFKEAGFRPIMAKFPWWN